MNVNLEKESQTNEAILKPSPLDILSISSKELFYSNSIIANINNLNN